MTYLYLTAGQLPSSLRQPKPIFKHDSAAGLNFRVFTVLRRVSHLQVTCIRVEIGIILKIHCIYLITHTRLQTGTSCRVDSPKCRLVMQPLAKHSVGAAVTAFKNIKGAVASPG